MIKQQKLWLSVVIQALDDFSNDSPTVVNKQDIPHVKQEAVAWFKNNTNDYKEVCESAGINPVWLRKVVLNSDKSRLQALIYEYRRIVQSS